MNRQTPTFGIFATPIFRATTGSSELADMLTVFLLSKENSSTRNPDSPQQIHKNLFESRFDLFHWHDPEIESLKQVVYGGLMQYVKDINGCDDQALANLSFNHESWFHITRKGGYFQPHTHPLASVSLIYCVDPGDEEMQDENEAGYLVLSDPRHNASMYLDPANHNMTRDYTFNTVRFRLKKDELLIFPSYLQHHVEPYMGETPRITIAANFSFSLK